MGKRGQLTLFVVLAILVICLILFLTFSPFSPFLTKTRIEKIENYRKENIANVVESSILVLGLSGGCYKSSNCLFLNTFPPVTVINKSNVSIEVAKESLRNLIEEGLDITSLELKKSFPSTTFIFLQPEIKINMEEKIIVNVKWPIKLRQLGRTAILAKPLVFEKEINFTKFLVLAREIEKIEMENLEEKIPSELNLSIDIINENITIYRLREKNFEFCFALAK